MAYSFHLFEPAARLHCVIEAMRPLAFQPLGRVFPVGPILSRILAVTIKHYELELN